LLSFLDTLKKLGPARLSIMGAVVLGLLMFFVFVTMRVSSPEMKMLYTDLNAADSSAVAAKLEELQIPYTISNDSTKVFVADTDVGRARMLLAQDGLPNGGSLGYELFDKQSSFGTTNFVQNINQVRALEGELARTIGSLEPVRSARVHLVLPQRELFSREARAASASVFLQLKGSGNLDREQIAGIQSLIASAVPDLKARDVSIIDSTGTPLAIGGAETETLSLTKNEELRREYEKRMQAQIEDMLGRVVGFGKVRATVTADLNFDRITQNEETFDPATQVVRSTQTVEENSNENQTDNNNVSVENNIPGGQENTESGSGTSSAANRTEETTNFEISKTVRNTVRETGEVKKLSVAVLVDGMSTTNAEGQQVYTPRSEEEMQRLNNIVRSAIGFNEERGDNVQVVNMQFAPIETSAEDMGDQLFGFEKSDLLDMAEVLMIVIMIILVVLLVLQPMVTKLLASENYQVPDAGPEDQALLTAGQQQAALMSPNMMGGNMGYQMSDAPPEDSMIDVQKVEGRVKASSLKKVEDIVSAYPEETVSVLRNWMTQES
jgi:flagellar M-ring protein FliF